MNIVMKILFFVAVWIGCNIVVLVICDLAGLLRAEEDRGLRAFIGLILAIVVMVIRRFWRKKSAAVEKA